MELRKLWNQENKGAGNVGGWWGRLKSSWIDLGGPHVEEGEGVGRMTNCPSLSGTEGMGEFQCQNPKVLGKLE